MPEKPKNATETSDDIDACDIDFTDAPPTNDEDLPVTTGGVG